MTTTRVLVVEIAGQQYPIRSALDDGYVATLAAYVEQKMRAASDVAPTSDTLGLAILVALNIADELFRCRDANRARDGELADRAGELIPHKSDPIVVVCRSGVRSTTAAAMLSGLGFDKVYNLQGGMVDWNDNGLPTER